MCWYRLQIKWEIIKKIVKLFLKHPVFACSIWFSVWTQTVSYCLDCTKSNSLSIRTSHCTGRSQSIFEGLLSVLFVVTDQCVWVSKMWHTVSVTLLRKGGILWYIAIGSSGFLEFVQSSVIWKEKRKHNVSETVCIFTLRWKLTDSPILSCETWSHPARPIPIGSLEINIFLGTQQSRRLISLSFQ
jgi:hypothetical protein